MRKAYLTIIWIVTVICIIGGTIYHVGGLVNFVGNSIFNSTDQGSKWYSHMVSGKCEINTKCDRVAIEADGNSMDFTLKKGDSWSAEYESVESLKPQIDVTEENGVAKLKISQPDVKGRPVNGRNLNCSLTITMPENVSVTDFSMDMDLGDVDINDIKADVLDMTLDLGDLDIKNCNVATLTANLDLGDVTVENTDLKKTDVESSLGDVNITDCEFDDMTVTADMGDIDIKSAKSLEEYMIDADVDMGKVRVNKKSCGDDYSQSGKGGSLTVDVSMGDVAIAW